MSSAAQQTTNLHDTTTESLTEPKSTTKLLTEPITEPKTTTKLKTEPKSISPTPTKDGGNVMYTYFRNIYKML